MDWSTFIFSCVIRFLDFGLRDSKVRYVLTATDATTAVASAQTIANRIKAITSLQIERIEIFVSYTDLDTDPPAGDREDVAYLTGFLPDDQWVATEIPAYSDTVLAGNIVDFTSPDLQGYMNLFTSDMLIAVQGQNLVDFCQGFLLNRGRVIP